MNELALFAGAGGGILGGLLHGWQTVAAVEIEDYPRRVLLQRQADGILPRFPIWDDVRTFDGKPWRNKIDIITGGFPCQDISKIGTGDGLEGKRSGLWFEMARICREVEPRFIFVENSAAIVGRGLNRVLHDMAALGFNAEWGVYSAKQAGAPHNRERMWILAHTAGPRLAQREGEQQNQAKELPAIIGTRWWELEPRMDRVVNGMADRVDRLKAIGNGQVPAVVQLAIKELTGATAILVEAP